MLSRCLYTRWISASWETCNAGFPDVAIETIPASSGSESWRGLGCPRAIVRIVLNLESRTLVILDVNRLREKGTWEMVTLNDKVAQCWAEMIVEMSLIVRKATGEAAFYIPILMVTFTCSSIAGIWTQKNSGSSKSLGDLEGWITKPTH